MRPKKKKIGLTSVEAAALYLSEGKTTDIKEAEMIDKGQELSMDGLMRAGLRRQMGFDFEMQQLPNVILFTSKERPIVRTRCKILEGETDTYGNIISEDLIVRMAEAGAALKDKWEEARQPHPGFPKPGGKL